MEGRSDVHLESSTTYSIPRLGSRRLRPHGARGCWARPPGRLGPPPRASPTPRCRSLRGPPRASAHEGGKRTGSCLTTTAGPPGPRPSGSGARCHPAASPRERPPPQLHPASAFSYPSRRARPRSEKTEEDSARRASRRRRRQRGVPPRSPFPDAGSPPGRMHPRRRYSTVTGLSARTRWGRGAAARRIHGRRHFVRRGGRSSAVCNGCRE